MASHREDAEARNSPNNQSSSNRAATATNSTEFEDCTPCRVMGAATFIGLGAYTLTIRPEKETAEASKNSFARALTRFAPQMRGGLGATFILLGLYRLVA